MNWIKLDLIWKLLISLQSQISWKFWKLQNKKTQIEEYLDIGKYLVNNIESTFFVRISGDSMINVGIYNNDIMVVDKSLTPKNQSIVVASLNGELVVKKFLKDKQGKCYLKSENENYPKIILDSKMETTIWGVATYVIHNLS